MIPDVLDVTPVMVANGAADTSPSVRVVAGQKGPRKVVHAELTGEHEGLWVDVWINFKRGMLRSFDAADNLHNGDVLCQLVVDHNMTYEDGEPYAKPLDLAAIDDMTLDLYQAVCDAVSQSIQAGIPKA